MIGSRALFRDLAEGCVGENLVLWFRFTSAHASNDVTIAIWLPLCQGSVAFTFVLGGSGGTLC